MEKIFVTLGKFFFRYRNGLFPATYAGLFLFTRPALFMNNAQVDEYSSAAGILIALAGQALRILVIGFAYVIRGGKGGKVYAESLVQTGFYAHSRNPMYVGNYLIMVGFVLLYGSLWAAAVVVPFFTLVYYAIVVSEEGYLKEKFGKEYDEYAARVNRFIPDFRGLSQSLHQYHYDWRKMLRKEYGTIALLFLAIVVLVQWKKVVISGMRLDSLEIGTIAVMLVPIALFYGTTRYLKKSGRLG